ncbi:hypothetical protein WL65_10705 [Burkholderia ubonensis]|nr:hypothetical protein WI83_15970 [Burkholderia ubonensis]KVP37981.1 hypothetical protein WJ88_03285 [Burkholderia ubonensis]KVP72614.1 hypothetical protein WJ94_24990 [Burkholderia ubonensis]KVQ04854.1 hypothetical protein WJ98_09665 [Burkholderia ubonensis]KVR57255.1 hypothetical protein WK19_10515 [Burkholderia ubonensis]
MAAVRGRLARRGRARRQDRVTQATSGRIEDVADAVAWLLSDDARFVTEQSILLDGGFTLGGLRPWLNEVVAEHA